MTSLPPVLAGPYPHAIAHRGSRVLWPENTMVAFSGAFELGFWWLETDLHLTRDGVVVCFHDDTLERTTDATGPVIERTLAELKQVDAGYRFYSEGGYPYRGAGVKIPTLEEVVTTFPAVRVVVDLKQDGLEEPLADLIARLDLWDRLVVGSFSDERLQRFRVVTDYRVATSGGPEEIRRALSAAREGREIPDPEADALQVPSRYRGIRIITRDTVAAFKEKGYRVHVWTVNSPQQMHRLLDLGVGGLITDRPDLLRDVLRSRGVWARR